ncbi:MAG: DUF1684 domain-containing protein [Chloroflexota bacterium]
MRAARDVLFRDHPQSPLPAAERAAFGGLAYFDYDPAYRFTAVVDLAEEATASTATAPLLQLPSSGVEPFSFRRIGLVHLAGPLAGASLPLFWMECYGGGLFLPFRDATSGSATYGAGRYLLDGAKSADLGGDWRRGELLLDFNLAYHPSCAYDPKWSCPLAPPQSRLTLAVPVGERLR